MHLVVQYTQRAIRKRQGIPDSPKLSPDAWPASRLVGLPSKSTRPRLLSRLIVTGSELVPTIAPGASLEPGGVYLDLSGSISAPFRAMPGQRAGQGNQYVAENRVPVELWRPLNEAMSKARLALENADESGVPIEVRIAIVTDQGVAVDASLGASILN